MPHLVEERDDVVVPHERGALGRRLGEVRDHRRERVAALAVGARVAREQSPDRRVRVLRRWAPEVSLL